MTTKKQAAHVRMTAIAFLHQHIKPNTKVYTVQRHKSASGRTRSISLFVVNANGEPWEISGMVARVLGDKFDQMNGGIKTQNQASDLVYDLGFAMWPNGTSEPHGVRNGEPDSSGGYALKHIWL